MRLQLLIAAFSGYVTAIKLLEGFIPGLTDVDVFSSYLVLRDTDSGEQNRYYLGQSGNFSIPVATDHRYELAVQSTTVASPQIFEVVMDSDEEIIVRKQRGPLMKQPLSIDWKRKELVVDRPVFSIWKMVKSPTVLMSLASLLMVVAVPYILDNLDPEMLEELKEQERDRSNRMRSVQENMDVAKMIADRRKV